MECTWKDPEKKSSPNGPLLELKKRGQPCNYCELVIIIIVVLLLHGNQDIPHFRSYFFFFQSKLDIFEVWYESLELKIVTSLLTTFNVKIFRLRKIKPQMLAAWIVIGSESRAQITTPILLPVGVPLKPIDAIVLRWSDGFAVLQRSIFMWMLHVCKYSIHHSLPMLLTPTNSLNLRICTPKKT